MRSPIRTYTADDVENLLDSLASLDNPKPWLLDAYCCEGPASRGYDQAGFRVFGVDIFKTVDPRKGFSQSRYPYASVAWDAVDFITRWGHRFDAIHTSPPCWAKTAGLRADRAHGISPHVNLIPVTRDALLATGKPYIIENVEGARDDLIDPVMLCGTAFDLRAVDTDGTKLEMWRHRLFESNVPIIGSPCLHGSYSEQVAGSYGGARKDKVEARHVRHGGYVPSKEIQRQLLGVDWTTVRGMHQCLPPAYTRYLGQQLMGAL